MAKATLENAYSPYSRVRVASAVEMDDGSVFAGCNVENASYGATICAERVALVKAVSEGKVSLKKILILSEADKPWPPCGMCRQVMAEFGHAKTQVILANTKGKVKRTTLAKIFPEAFFPAHLKKVKRTSKHY